MKITTIIPVINLWAEYTEPCIKSLLKSANNLKDCELEIIVIDNGSKDETCERLEQGIREGLNIKLIRNSENIGVSKSWNMGIEMAKDSDYIFVINNDTLFDENCLKELINRFKEGDLIMLSPGDGGGNGDICDFAAFMIDKRLFEIVGKFDENFSPAYFEDNCMRYRIKLSNNKSLQLGKAIFKHFGSKTQFQVREKIVSDSQFEKNREYYFKKWGGLPDKETFKNPFNDINKSIKWTKQENGQ